MLNVDALKQYKAKSYKLNIYQHNQDLIDILNQLDLSNETQISMTKIINYHDIGKVVQSFQDDIEGKKREIRHEIISASVKNLTVEERVVIITHHKNLDYVISELRLLSEDDYYSNLYLSQLKEVEDKLNIEMIDIRKEVLRYKRKRDLLTDKNVIVLKGLLNYCDHLGSANLKEIDKGFDANEKFKFSNYTTIQQQAKTQNGNIIIIGATGSGKTEASLFWASNIDKDKNKRMFYILPYTASITSMYQRLKKDEISVGMLHSKAEYFLSKELESKEGQGIKSKYQTFKYFTKQITISTMHQIFKAMFNCKFNEMMLSMYQNSIFIIDEIHCYDQKELAIMLTTLKYLKDHYSINVCIMSASIPTSLLILIKQELDIDTILKLSKEENGKIKRHRVYYKDKYINDDIEMIKENYYNNKKTIICVNTVSKSQEMYKRLREFVDKDDIVLLHSAFNQRDRERIEKQIKDKKILVGTQAIEVSLDIDYDEMFTEISPIDSQIQRWGRVNRKRVEQLKERKNIYVYNDDSKIYDKEIIERTRNVLMSITDVDENKIQEYLDAVYDDDFYEYYKYKNDCIDIFHNIQIANWDNQYNDIVKFSGASVLPVCFTEEYEQLMAEKRYLEANSLLVNISERKYKSALSKGDIDVEKNYIKYDYDSEIGLKFGERVSGS